MEKKLYQFVCWFIYFFVLENFQKINKINYCAKLLIEHNYIATVVCISLVCLTS